MDTTFRDRLIKRVPLFLQDPSIWVPLIVGFYVLILGLCLTGALKRQKVSIRELRREQKNNQCSLPSSSNSDDGSPVNPANVSQGKKRTGKKRGDI
ncbi:hypothetical protein WAI453_004338 [Rhynchosporium graminicola]|uniref:Uncharacterized protein n=1 Tax=Rhynchosporium graminicola TaxID=2792576 RepID=A0A1E1LMP2_9HELO|nr:uncharacterized protein RCO7_08669 [Rhynchosporium commune]